MGGVWDKRSDERWWVRVGGEYGGVAWRVACGERCGREAAQRRNLIQVQFSFLLLWT